MKVNYEDYSIWRRPQGSTTTKKMLWNTWVSEAGKELFEFWGRVHIQLVRVAWQSLVLLSLTHLSELCSSLMRVPSRHGVLSHLPIEHTSLSSHTRYVPVVLRNFPVWKYTWAFLLHTAVFVNSVLFLNIERRRASWNSAFGPLTTMALSSIHWGDACLRSVICREHKLGF